MSNGEGGIFWPSMGDIRRNDVRLTADFRAYEGECRGEGCCNHALIVVPRLWRALQCLRWRIGKPVILTCVYRCRAHNEAVGGKPDSDHLTGEAADVVNGLDTYTARELAELALHCGFVRVGYYPRKNFIHASVRERPGLPKLWDGERDDA